MNDQASLATWVRTDDLSRYPANHVRAEVDARLIAEYAEAMMEGAQFPPVMIFEEENGDRYLADGLHRTDAAALAALKDPNRKPQVLAEIRRGTLIDALTYAMQANVRHGKRLTEADYKRQIGLAFEYGLISLLRADTIVPGLVQLLGCSVRTAQVHSEAKRRELRQQRDRSILAMHKLGWTQERIAEAVGLKDRSTVSDIIARNVGKRSDAETHKQDKRIQPPMARLGPEDAKAEKAEAEKVEHDLTTAQTGSPDEPRYRINVSPYLPLLDAMRPLEEPDDDGGVVVIDLPEDGEVDVSKSATKGLSQIEQVLNEMLKQLDQPKGMQRRYPEKAAEAALDALERAIEFLTDLEAYVKDGVQ
jgi:hypothetical protein